MTDLKTQVHFENRGFEFPWLVCIPHGSRFAAWKFAKGASSARAGRVIKSSRSVVIGDEVEKKLFAGQSAVGNTIRVGGLSFQVIGILKHKVPGRRRERQQHDDHSVQHHG